MPAAVTSLSQIETLEKKLESQKAKLRDLATMGAVITSIHDIDAILSVVMDMAVGLVSGEVGMIMLEENSELVARISWGIDEKFVRALVYKDEVNLAAYCFKNQKTAILNELCLISDRRLQVESVICVPIKTSSKCYGVNVIINKQQGGSFNQDDIEILQMLMNFVAVSIDNSTLLQEKLEKQKMEQEIAIARQVQKTILPENIDDIKGVEIGAEYIPAKDVGGDFYDVISANNDQFVVVLGDVSNKGIPAALVMSAASGIIKSVLEFEPDVEMSLLAEKVNKILATGIIKDRETFVTLFFARFDLKAKELSYCNAGHLPGLFFLNSAGKEIMKLSKGGTLLGQFPETKYIIGKVPLAAGSRLFLFTDGLTESVDSNMNLFGMDRTEELFKKELELEPQQFCRKVKNRIDEYSIGSEIEYMDDLTVLQIKVN
ncbi:MAG: GAF domain-containing SpoIIE family protein phosphatase [candidate division Zixibacteria bacterium]